MTRQIRWPAMVIWSTGVWAGWRNFQWSGIPIGSPKASGAQDFPRSWMPKMLSACRLWSPIRPAASMSRSPVGIDSTIAPSFPEAAANSWPRSSTRLDKTLWEACNCSAATTNVANASCRAVAEGICLGSFVGTCCQKPHLLATISVGVDCASGGMRLSGPIIRTVDKLLPLKVLRPKLNRR